MQSFRGSKQIKDCGNTERNNRIYLLHRSGLSTGEIYRRLAVEGFINPDTGRPLNKKSIKQTWQRMEYFKFVVMSQSVIQAYMHLLMTNKKGLSTPPRVLKPFYSQRLDGLAGQDYHSDLQR